MTDKTHTNWAFKEKRLECMLEVHPRSRQRGVAAIEFGLVVGVMLLLFTGLVSLGGIMWAQQTLTQAVAEGGRAMMDSGLAGETNVTTLQTTGCDIATNAMSWMSVKCAVASGQAMQSCGWQSATGPAQCVTLTLTYDTSGWPLLASMSSLASALGVPSLVPAKLTASSFVQIQEFS